MEFLSEFLSKGIKVREHGERGSERNKEFYEELENLEQWIRIEPPNKVEFYKNLEKIRKCKKPESKFRYIVKICASVRNVSTVDKMMTLKAIDIQFFGLLLRASITFRYYALRTINCLFDRKTNIYLKALIPFVNVLIYRYLGKLKILRKKLIPCDITNNSIVSEEHTVGSSKKQLTRNDSKDRRNMTNYRGRTRSSSTRDIMEKEVPRYSSNIIDIISQINFDSDTADEFNDSDFEEDNVTVIIKDAHRSVSTAVTRTGSVQEQGNVPLEEGGEKGTTPRSKGVESKKKEEKEEQEEKEGSDHTEEFGWKYCDVYDEAILYFLNLQAVNLGEEIVHNILYDVSLNDIDEDADMYFLRKRQELKEEEEEEESDDEDGKKYDEAEDKEEDEEEEEEENDEEGEYGEEKKKEEEEEERIRKKYLEIGVKVGSKKVVEEKAKEEEKIENGENENKEEIKVEKIGGEHEKARVEEHEKESEKEHEKDHEKDHHKEREKKHEKKPERECEEREEPFACRSSSGNDLVFSARVKDTREVVNCINEIGYSNIGIKLNSKRSNKRSARGSKERETKEKNNKKEDVASRDKKGKKYKKDEPNNEEMKEGEEEKGRKEESVSGYSYCNSSSISSAPTLYDFSGCGKKVSTIKYLFYILYEHILIEEALLKKKKEKRKKKKNEEEKKQVKHKDPQKGVDEKTQRKERGRFVGSEKEETCAYSDVPKECLKDPQEDQNVKGLTNGKQHGEIKDNSGIDVEDSKVEKKNKGAEKEEEEEQDEEELVSDDTESKNKQKEQIEKELFTELKLQLGEDLSSVMMNEQSMKATILFLNNAIVRLSNKNYIDSYFFLLNRLLETFNSCHPVIVLCLEIFLKYVYKKGFVYLLSEENINKFYANVIALFPLTHFLPAKNMLYRLYSTIYTCLKYKYVEKKSLSIFTCPIGYMAVELNTYITKMVDFSDKNLLGDRFCKIEDLRGETVVLICQNIEQIIHFLSFHVCLYWSQEQVISKIKKAQTKKMKKARFRSETENPLLTGMEEKGIDGVKHVTEHGTERLKSNSRMRSSNSTSMNSQKRSSGGTSKEKKSSGHYTSFVDGKDSVAESDYFEYEYLTPSHVNVILTQLKYIVESIADGLLDLSKNFDLVNFKSYSLNNTASATTTTTNVTTSTNAVASSNTTTTTTNTTMNMNKNKGDKKNTLKRLEDFVAMFKPQLNAIIRFFASYVMYDNVFYTDAFIKVIDFCAFCIDEADFRFLLLLGMSVRADSFYKKDIFLTKMFHYVFDTNMKGVNYMCLPLQIFYKYPLELVESIQVKERKNVTGNMERIVSCKNDYLWIPEASSVDVVQLKAVKFVYIISNEEYQYKRDLYFQRNVENIVYFVYDFFFNYYFVRLGQQVKKGYDVSKFREVKHDLIRDNFYSRTNNDIKRNTENYIPSMIVLLSVSSMLFLRFDLQVLSRFLDKSECFFIFDCLLAAFLNVKQANEMFPNYLDEHNVSLVKIYRRFVKIMYILLYHHPLFVSFFIHRVKTQKLGHVFKNLGCKEKPNGVAHKVYAFFKTFTETYI